MIVDAVALMVRTWQTEQHHEQMSPYRYFELPRNGRGALSNFTGALLSQYAQKLHDASEMGHVIWM